MRAASPHCGHTTEVAVVEGGDCTRLIMQLLPISKYIITRKPVPRDKVHRWSVRGVKVGDGYESVTIMSYLRISESSLAASRIG
jgi:hypothetical protein